MAIIGEVKDVAIIGKFTLIFIYSQWLKKFYKLYHTLKKKNNSEYDAVLFCSCFCLGIIFVIRDLPGSACTHGILSSVSVVFWPLHDAIHSIIILSCCFCRQQLKTAMQGKFHLLVPSLQSPSFRLVMKHV